MPIENILRRIEEETEASVREILEKAKAEAALVRADYTSRAQRLDEELRTLAKRKAEEEERRLIVSEQLELRKALLAKKCEILGELYEEARKNIESLPEERYLALLKNLIVRRAVSGKEEIVVPESQKKLFTQDFIDSLSSAFPGKGSFTVASENGEFTWGVVMREGRRVVDLTLRVLFEQLKEKVEPEIAALLFPEE